MNEVSFSDSFRELFLKEFFRDDGDANFLKNTIIQFPDSEQVIEYDDFQLGLFLKWRIADEVAILVIAEIQNGDCIIVAGFKILASLLQDYRFEPMIVLGLLTNKFGDEIVIRDIAAKLIVKEQFRLLDYNIVFENVETQLFTIRASRTGLSCFKLKQIQDGLYLDLYIALAFSIDTYAYSKWLFNWETIEPRFSQWLSFSKNTNIPSSKLALTNDELDTIYDLIREHAPDDETKQKSGIPLMGSYMLLKKIFGTEWYDRILKPTETSNFLNRDWQNALENITNMSLIVMLASALYDLQDIPGFSATIEKAKRNTKHGDNLESLWFEFFVPHVLLRNGHKVMNFIPEVEDAHTPDLLIEFNSQLLPIEIKAKLEDTQYNKPRDLTKLLRKACSEQIPETGPGVIFLLIPTDWTINEKFVQKAEKLIQEVLLDNRNCNAIYIYWFESFQLEDGRFVSAMKFRPFVNKHPRYLVPRIIELIKSNNFDEAMLEVGKAPYLKKVAE